MRWELVFFMRRRLYHETFLLGVAACLLGGCSAGGEAEAEAEAEAEYGPAVVYEDTPSDTGNAALLTGILAVDDGCLVVESEVGTYLILWPASSTSFDSQSGSITWNEVERGQVNSEVSLGGGESSSTASSLRLIVPDGCDEDRPSWLVPSME